ITGRGRDYVERRPIGPARRRYRLQLSVSGGGKQGGEPTFRSKNHRLGFRIAETGVELQNVRIPGVGDHQPDVKHPAVRNVLDCELAQQTRDDAALDLRFQVGVEIGRGRDRAHAAGIGTGVPITNAFEVGGGRKGDEMFAVTNADVADFATWQKTFDQHRVRAGTELALLPDATGEFVDIG